MKNHFYPFVLIFIIFFHSSCGQTTTVSSDNAWGILEGKLIAKKNSKDSIAKKYWNYLNEKLPEKLLTKYISKLQLFSDGTQEELGAITPLNTNNTTWEIALDTTDFNFKNNNQKYILDYTHTIIHEFGHLLTLNPEQVTITKDEYQDDKKGYLTSEGYAKKDSYLGKFVQKFWKTKLLNKWDKIDTIEDENKKLEQLYDFYLDNKNCFLTDYAAESPEEDIAEAWTFFVLNNKPTHNKIKHKKVLFFYNFPELVAYRNQIRKNLKSDILLN
ncbi:putative zinc-binding metallopeptidase [uncultured Polaribacter sp.]|uniref:putative zinc-binding metallopeptidase n=1 Tax=uncultured Polaribacter sp. TaxID=174711 RepID=UPI002616690C|nr:putative zinc-binding metallopeptidase [uncultured Polaribacter sp.]